MILHIRAVHRQDQEVLEQDQRRRRAAVMAAGQVVPFPEHLAGGGVQTRRAKAAEVDIDPARLDHRRRRGVTIHRGAVAERLRVVAVKHLFVEANLAGLGIHADGEEVMAILGRGGQPDLAAHHHRAWTSRDGESPSSI